MVLHQAMIHRHLLDETLGVGDEIDGNRVTHALAQSKLTAHENRGHNLTPELPYPSKCSAD